MVTNIVPPQLNISSICIIISGYIKYKIIIICTSDYCPGIIIIRGVYIFSCFSECSVFSFVIYKGIIIFCELIIYCGSISIILFVSFSYIVAYKIVTTINGFILSTCSTIAVIICECIAIININSCFVILCFYISF